MHLKLLRITVIKGDLSTLDNPSSLLTEGTVLRTYVLFCILAISSSVFASQKLAMTPSELVKALQQGGYILYIRHGKTQLSQKDSPTADLSDCSKQRNLSEEGIQQTQEMAKQLKQHGIAVKQVWSSPYCRCVDTAKYLFGDFLIEPQLQFSISKNPVESKKLGMALKRMMLELPQDGHNYAFVGHTSNLRDGVGVWPKPEGVMVVFKNQSGKLVYQGMIQPNDWRTLESSE